MIIDTTPHLTELDIPEGTVIHPVGFNKNVPKWKWMVFNFLDEIIKLLTELQRKL
jgi:hypothetical protein